MAIASTKDSFENENEDGNKKQEPETHKMKPTKQNRNETKQSNKTNRIALQSIHQSVNQSITTQRNNATIQHDSTVHSSMMESSSSSIIVMMKAMHRSTAAPQNLPRISSAVASATPEGHILRCLFIDGIAPGLFRQLFLLDAIVWKIHGCCSCSFVGRLRIGKGRDL